MKLAVVILNWNGLHHLKSFLPSVTEYSKPYPVFVVDNASSDGSQDWLRTTHSDITLISNTANEGFCMGYNKGLKKINAEYYVILNSDVEVTPGWLGPVIDLLDSQPDVAAVQPKILSFSSRRYFEYAGAAGGHIDLLGYPFCRGRIFDTLEEDTGQYDDETEIFWATGACMFIRASLFHELQGFDPSFFAHMEEIDLCWRLKNRGYRIMYTSKSKVYHLGGGTLQKSSPFKTYLNFRNNLFLLYKNLPGVCFLKILLLRLILDGIAGIRHLIKLETAHTLAIIKAHFSFYSHIISKKVVRDNIIGVRQHLIYPHSIIKKYFLNKKKFYTDLRTI